VGALDDPAYGQDDEAFENDRRPVRRGALAAEDIGVAVARMAYDLDIEAMGCA
jgi:hypothetical protein